MMTQADRDRRQARLSLASFIVSILAFIASITGPFVAYYWLQGSLRIYELKRSSFLAEGEIGTSPSNCEGRVDTGPKFADYGVSLNNSGSLPIEKVRVLIEKRHRYIKTPDLDPKTIKASPPVPLEIENNDRGIVVTFKDAIPPRSLIFLTLTELTKLNKNASILDAGPSVWVISEVSGEPILWSKAYIWEYDCP